MTSETVPVVRVIEDDVVNVNVLLLEVADKLAVVVEVLRVSDVFELEVAVSDAVELSELVVWLPEVEVAEAVFVLDKLVEVNVAVREVVVEVVIIVRNRSATRIWIVVAP